jgi:transposase
MTREERMSRRDALTDEQWSKLEPLLLGRKGQIGRTAKNNSLFIELVL